MATKTINYNLIKPSQDDFYNIDDFNGNADKIDDALKKIDNKINENKESVNSTFSSIERKCEEFAESVKGNFIKSIQELKNKDEALEENIQELEQNDEALTRTTEATRNQLKILANSIQRLQREKGNLEGKILTNKTLTLDSQGEVNVYKLTDSQIRADHFADVVLGSEKIENYSPTGKIETGSGWLKVYTEERPDTSLIVDSIMLVREVN